MPDTPGTVVKPPLLVSGKKNFETNPDDNRLLHFFKDPPRPRPLSDGWGRESLLGTRSGGSARRRVHGGAAAACARAGSGHQRVRPVSGPHDDSREGFALCQHDAPDAVLGRLDEVKQVCAAA